MPEDLPMRRVEISFVGPAPVRQVERASGVSEVEVDGSTLRCLICGSFQPFLEALRGHEVLGLLSRVVIPEDASPSSRHSTASTIPGAA
jgi:hypothetical protein